MTDRRLTPMNARVAAAHLDNVPEGVARVEGIDRSVLRPVVDLMDSPEGRRDRQLLFGDPVTVYEDRDGWSFLRAARNGYVGYARTADLGPAARATHWISARLTHIYQTDNIKSPDRMNLSFGSRVAVHATSGDLAETAEGFVPRQHLTPLNETMQDPVEVASLFLGTPYLWGGDSAFGIDCSGLVHAAFGACGLDCPGDSDLQQAALGRPVPDGTPPEPGDLLFWKGHVAFVADAGTLLHANGYHMAVQYEPLLSAIDRIAAQGDGPVVAHKRL